MLDRRSIVALVILSVLGLLGNLLKIEMFFNVDFLFGSIFAMLAVQIFGFYGIIVAFIAGLYTIVLWNHPYAVVIFTAEAAFVAVFQRRFKNIVAADLLYWVAAGAPLVLFFYFVVMDLSIRPTLLIVMKQTVNGTFGALVASVIYDVYKFLIKSDKTAKTMVSFQHIVFQLIVFIILIPTVMYVMISVKNNTEFTSAGMRDSFNMLLEATRASASHYAENSLLKVEYVAKEVKSHKDDREGLIREFKDILRANREFAGIGVLDSAFKEKLSVSNYEGSMNISEGGDFRFAVGEKTALESGKIYISDIRSHSVGRVIYLVLPLENSGYVYCVLDFSIITDTIALMSKDAGMVFSLYDRNGDLIMSTASAEDTMGRLTDRTKSGVLELKNDGIAVWTPLPAENVTIMKRWRKAILTKSVLLNEEMPFTLVADMPLIGFVQYMGKNGNAALAVIFIVGIFSITAGHYISSKMTKHITLLAKQSKDLPEKLRDGGTVEWPETRIIEANLLKENLIHMGEQLNERFDELQKQKEELNLLLDNIPMMILLKDTENNIIRANKKGAEIIGLDQHSINKLPLESILPEYSAVYYKKDRRVISTKKGIYNEITRYRFTPDAEIIARVSRIPLIDKEGEVESILVVVEDITDEIKAGDEKQKMLDVMNHQAKMAEMGAMINVIAHQWRQPLNVIGLVVQNLKDILNEKEINRDEIAEDVVMLDENSRFLTETIDYFSDFFRKTKSLSLFNVDKVVKDVYFLIERQFLKNAISVKVDETGSFEVCSHMSEFKQIILNLFNNARDALVEQGRKDGKITISYERYEEYGKIIFKDNAGGISADLLPDKLFEPYVTTKGSNGTGIGLYVSRSLAKDNMRGNLTVVNEDGGARFELTIPYGDVKNCSG